jgi:arylformamidase
MPLLDVSLRLSARLPTYPGNPPWECLPVKRVARGDSSNVSALHLGTHTGTHVDAPRHFFDAGPGVDELPLEVLVGPARVVHLPGVPAVGAAELAPLDLAGVTRLLIRTDNSALWEKGSEFTPGFVYLAEDGARLLASRGIRLIGVDYLSVERFKAPGAPTHHALLGAGIVVIEGLDLSAAAPGDYELMCLPLKVAGGDGAPARVVLRSGQTG